MFDFSFAEGFIILFVGLVVLGPKDLSKIIKYSKNLINQIKKHSSDFIKQFDEECEVSELSQQSKKINEELKTIIDLDGNEQITYQLDDLTEEIELYKNRNKK